MIKKIIISFLLIFTFISPLIFTENVSAKTLRSYYSELAELESKKEKSEAEKAALEAKMIEYASQIKTSQDVIENSKTEIAFTQNEIIRLSGEIEKKKEEINKLIKFKHISSGDNIYLEYIFGASDFTDFIYRSAIVEELSTYNDRLIDEMYSLIEQNKKLAEELEVKIIEEEKAINEFNNMLASLSIESDDLSEIQIDVGAEIKALKAEIQFLEDNNCDIDEEISECISMPYADGFIKPVKSGWVTSNYGNRLHPTKGYYRFHAGIDLGLGGDGYPVYPAAAGIVTNIVYFSDCGGNQITIQHIIGGNRYTTVYMHLLSMNVSLGDIVTSNTLIAYSGGESTSADYGGYDTCTNGGHLHFEIHLGFNDSNASSTDPRNYISFPALGGYFSSRY